MRLVLLIVLLLAIPVALAISYDNPFLPHIEPPEVTTIITSNASFNQSATDALYIRKDGTTTTSANIPFTYGITVGDITGTVTRGIRWYGGDGGQVEGVFSNWYPSYDAGNDRMLLNMKSANIGLTGQPIFSTDMAYSSTAGISATTGTFSGTLSAKDTSVQALTEADPLVVKNSSGTTRFSVSSDGRLRFRGTTTGIANISWLGTSTQRNYYIPNSIEGSNFVMSNSTQTLATAALTFGNSDPLISSRAGGATWRITDTTSGATLALVNDGSQLYLADDQLTGAFFFYYRFSDGYMQVGEGSSVVTNLTLKADKTVIEGAGLLQLRANTTAKTCNADNAGALYYDGSVRKHYGCNSTTWNALY